MNPGAHEKLKEEVRTVFQSQEEINLISVNKLPYMLACLDEAMRMYPPIANGLPRLCPEVGATILGEYIPKNVSLTSKKQIFQNLLTNLCEDLRINSSMGTLPARRVLQGPQYVPPRTILGRLLIRR